MSQRIIDVINTGEYPNIVPLLIILCQICAAPNTCLSKVQNMFWRVNLHAVADDICKVNQHSQFSYISVQRKHCWLNIWFLIIWKEIRNIWLFSSLSGCFDGAIHHEMKSLFVVHLALFCAALTS